MTEPAAAPTCPPHHWLIEGYASKETWTCKRCGVERQHDEAAARPDRPQWGASRQGGAKRAPRLDARVVPDEAGASEGEVHSG
jgi:hypothetical protein